MIFLTGPHCAGKTTIAEILMPYNFNYLDLGPTLRELHQEESNSLSFEEWLSKGEANHGRYFTDDLLVKAIKECREKLLNQPVVTQDLIICGSRSLEGISYLTQRVSRLNDWENTIVWVEAPKPLLWQRFCEKNGATSMAEFEVLLRRDKELGLDTIREHVDHILINNGPTIESLGEKTNELFFEKLRYSREGLTVTVEGKYKVNKESRP